MGFRKLVAMASFINSVNVEYSHIPSLYVA